jgi:hypothetical protein
MPLIEDFLRQHGGPICADCLGTQMSISEQRVLLQLDRMGGDGVVRLIVGKCPHCRETLPTYRLAA